MDTMHSAAIAAARHRAERDRREAARKTEEARREAEEDRSEAERDRAEALHETERDRLAAERDRAAVLREAREARDAPERDRIETLSGVTSNGRRGISCWRLSAAASGTSYIQSLTCEGSMNFGSDGISFDSPFYRIERNGDKTVASVFTTRGEGDNRTDGLRDSQSGVVRASEEVVSDAESDAESSAGQPTPDASDNEDGDSRLLEAGSDQRRLKPFQATVEDASDGE